jgi:cytochrome P450
MGKFIDLVPDPKFQKSRKIVQKHVKRFVDKALATQASLGSKKVSNRYIYLHEMVASTSDPTELMKHALSILLAAKDTTSAALSSTFYLLVRHPEVWRKLSAKITTELNREIPAFEQLKKLKYLYHVINEGISSLIFTPIF